MILCIKIKIDFNYGNSKEKHGDPWFWSWWLCALNIMFLVLSLAVPYPDFDSGNSMEKDWRFWSWGFCALKIKIDFNSGNSMEKAWRFLILFMMIVPHFNSGRFLAILCVKHEHSWFWFHNSMRKAWIFLILIILILCIEHYFDSGYSIFILVLDTLKHSTYRNYYE